MFDKYGGVPSQGNTASARCSALFLVFHSESKLHLSSFLQSPIVHVQGRIRDIRQAGVVYVSYECIAGPEAAAEVHVVPVMVLD